MPGQIGSSAWVSPHTSFPRPAIQQPTQPRPAIQQLTQQAGNLLQPDIGNFVTGVDQPESGGTSGSGSLPGSSHAKLRGDELDTSPNQNLAKLRPGSIQAQHGGKDDEGNLSQGPSSTNFVEVITSVSDDSPVDHAEQVASTSGSSQITRRSSSEKVPVDGAVSVNYNTEVPAHFHQKCPVEMSYNCVTKYFSHEMSSQLGAGGFGKVYKGTVTVSLLSRCVMVSDGDKREG